MHIVISVKDFKAIVTHAETLRESITARFSYPTRPLQFSYQNFGMHCEFTLMTTGEYRGTSTTPAPKYASTRNPSRQQSMAPPPSEVSRSACEIAPPARPTIGKPVSSQSQRTSLKKRIEQPSVDGSDPDPDSLFMPAGEMDQAWDPPNYDNEEAEEMLGWDASNSNPSTGFHQTFRDSGTVGRPKASRPASVFDNEGLEPTQRLSQVGSSNIVDGPKSWLTYVVSWYVRLSPIKKRPNCMSSKFEIFSTVLKVRQAFIPSTDLMNI